jgi:hypothetical protein
MGAATVALRLEGHWDGHRYSEGCSELVVFMSEYGLLLVYSQRNFETPKYAFTSARWGEGLLRLGEGPPRPAVYKFVGGKLVLCVSRTARRPTSFTAGDGVDLYVLERSAGP